MNDCVWCCITLCDCNHGKCDNYISANSPEGEAILDKWENTVDNILEPLRVNFAIVNGFRKDGK